MNRVFRKAGKRAQSGGAAGALIALIGLVLILYILFLPPETREELLSDNETATKASYLGNETVLLENPGTLEYIRDSKITHTIPSLTIYTQTNAVILSQKESAYIKTSLFGKKPLTLNFKLDDLENTDNVLISGNLRKRGGRLMVSVNGNEVFNSPIATPNLNPITIPKEFLQDNNEVVISASGVGLAFWAVNEFQIDNFKITADIKDVEAQGSENIFLVSSTENSNAEGAYLKFFADCAPANVGKLKIDVNGHEIFYQIPDCGTRIVQPFSPHYLSSGQNKIMFYTEKGLYSLYSISVESELRQISNPVYYFELDDEDYQNIANNLRDLTLKIEFIDDIEAKRADIVVNGHMIRLDDYDMDYSRDISAYAEKGTNGIKIIPLSTLDIVSLEVLLD